jgi:hypothetical protein
MNIVKIRSIINWLGLVASIVLLAIDVFHGDFLLMIVALILVFVFADNLREIKRQNHE